MEWHWRAVKRVSPHSFFLICLEGRQGIDGVKWMGGRETRIYIGGDVHKNELLL